MMNLSMGFGAATLVVILFVCAFLTSMPASSAYGFSLLTGLLVTGTVYCAHPLRRRRS
jgi:K+ transporter